jgi:hypothetical protein
MRPLRRRPSHDPDRERDEPPPREQGHAPVLALQRTAGNAAVAAWLGSRPGAVIARRNLPEDADTLEDVASAAKEITIDTTAMTIGSVANWVTASRGTEREGIAVDIRFPGPMAKPGASADAEKKVTTALSAMGMATFNLRAGSRGPAKLDVVSFADLDFTPYGGLEGHYRFTCVTRKQRKGKQDAEVDLIIELVRAVRPAFKQWKDLGRDRRAALEARFSKFGFRKAEPTMERVVDTWLEDQWARVLQALEVIPEDTLAAVPGIEWVRGHGKLGPTGEGGHFSNDPNKKTRTLMLFDDAFSSDDGLVALMAHELGHALSFKPSFEKPGTASVASTKAFQDAAKADGKPITSYGATHLEEQYAESYSMFISEPETMKLLRPKLFEFFTKYPGGAKP